MSVKKCEGNCNHDFSQCERPAKEVKVIGWGNFWYCEEAIKEDRDNRGFQVIIFEEFK